MGAITRILAIGSAIASLGLGAGAAGAATTGAYERAAVVCEGDRITVLAPSIWAADATEGLDYQYVAFRPLLAVWNGASYVYAGAQGDYVYGLATDELPAYPWFDLETDEPRGSGAQTFALDESGSYAVYAEYLWGETADTAEGSDVAWAGSYYDTTTLKYATGCKYEAPQPAPTPQPEPAPAPQPAPAPAPAPGPGTSGPPQISGPGAIPMPAGPGTSPSPGGVSPGPVGSQSGSPAPVATPKPEAESAPQGCTVPKLRGLKLGAAITKLVGARCSLGKITKSRTARARKGTVVGQSAAPGTKLPLGAEVRLVVARGKAAPRQK